MKAIKFIPPYCAQGDLNIFSCDEIPKSLEEAKTENGNYVLAHSETGHHHVVDGNTVRVFNEDDFVSYLDVQEETNIVHLRNFDTHRPISLPPGKYRISRQREYTPEGFRRAAD
ncbi:MAG: hypothetical protein JAY90_20045 [Candidatus Thiodiazotropha lotti]|nr:hypothetical protein [Candidatus Thiodiazotropha lotti]